MKLLPGLIFITLLLSNILKGQDVTLYGSSSDYANINVPVEYIYNPITGDAQILDTLRIDKKGKFSLELTTGELRWIQMDMGIYSCVMLIMPGHKYKIALPPKREKTEAEIRSPFFEPMIIHIRVLEDFKYEENFLFPRYSDINSRIFSFDTLLFRINIDQLQARSESHLFPIDSLISSIESSYKSDTSQYFLKYRNYRYGLIQMNSGNKSLKDIYNLYLVAKSPEIHNPAYFDLFSKMYEKFFYYFSRTEEGKNLNQIINLQHNLNKLRKELKKHNSIPNDTIADLVILKEISEGYYRDFFYKEALLMILDSLIAKPAIPEYHLYAVDVNAKLTKLMIGTPAPEFSLKDQWEKKRTLDDFQGKYILLMFCTTDNYACLKEYPFLKSMHEKHSDYLEIVTILITKSMDNMQDFMINNKYPWTCLYYDKNEAILDSYNIRAYPTCYLIGRDGKLIQSPATLPTEGLEQQLFRIMRSRGDL